MVDTKGCDPLDMIRETPEGDDSDAVIDVGGRPAEAQRFLAAATAVTGVLALPLMKRAPVLVEA